MLVHLGDSIEKATQKFIKREVFDQVDQTEHHFFVIAVIAEDSE